MNRRTTLRSLTVVLSVGAIFSTTIGTASAYHFGDTPLQDVKDQAQAANRCSGLTKAELASMVLAPTWLETGSGTAAHSPMTMGRYDMQSGLYSPWANTPRAFWHAGIGAWQLDPAGLGSALAAFHDINTWTAANKVADTMASRYCSASGTAAQRRDYAFSPWFACHNGNCEDLYQEHYCSGTDSVCQINQDPMPRWGGMKQRSCAILPQHGIDAFTCWFIDPANAEGDTGWRFADKDGSSNYSPLTHAFYNYWAAGSPQYEFRHWLEADTGYGRGEVFGSRRTGLNPRGSGVIDWTDGDVLCDLDTSKGQC